MKKYLKYILIFILIAVFNYLSTVIRMDEILNFGISSNILNGIMPYKDISLGVTPLYSFFMSLFLIIKKSYILYILGSSILGTICFYIIKKITKKGSILFLSFLLIASRPNVFLLILLLILIIIRMELEKLKYYKIRFDYLIGFIAGLIFLINQIIGILVIISIFITDKNKENRFLGLCIPLLILMNYLFITGSVIDFFSMIIYGTFNMFDITLNFNLVLSLIYVIVIFIEKIKMKSLKNNSLLLNLLLIFSISMFINNSFYVLFMNLILGLLYYLLAYRSLENEFYIKIIGVCYFTILFLFEIISLFITKPVFVTDINIFRYMLIDKESYNYINEINNNINNYKDKNIFIISESSYLFKLTNNLKINKYDLFNKKNINYNNYLKEIKETCVSSNCIFYINSDDTNIITDYVKDNYKNTNSLYTFNIYTCN